MRKLIYITIESKSRELYPKLFLINSALKKNFDCFIGDKVSIARAVKILGKGIYFYKSMNHYDTDHIKKIKKNNIYVVQDEEGGFARPNNKELNKFVTYRSSKKNIELVDRFYNWGKFDYSIYTKRYKKNKKKFIITGSPRMDLWREEIGDKIFSREIKKIKKFQKYVLIASSGVSSKIELKNRSIVDKFAKKLRNKKEINKKKLEHLYEFKIFKETVKLINYLAHKFPEVNFVIRKHPNENIKDWKKIITKFPQNVYFENRFDIYGWISMAECLIHTASTVGIQAFFMKKNVISFVPDIKGSHRGFSNQFGLKAKKLYTVSKLLSNILKKKQKININKTKLSILNNRICLKKHNSADMIVKDLYELSKNFSSENNKRFLTFYSYYFYIRSFLSEIKHFLSPPKKDVILKSRRSIKEKIPGGIKKFEIEDFYSNLFQGTSKANNIEIKSFGPNGFLIMKKKRIT